MIYQNRLDNLRHLMSEHHISLTAVNAGSDLTYFTGLSFHVSERPAILFIPIDSLPRFFFPEFEHEKVSNISTEILLFPYSEDTEQWPVIMGHLLNTIAPAIAQVFVAPESFRFLEMELIQKAMPELAFFSAAEMFKELRIIKDEYEQAAICKAVKTAEQAFQLTIPSIRCGQTEIEIANQLFIHLLEQGSSAELPFHPIVASGPNSANPHAVPCERCLQEGDLVVIDWGACWEGYISDITRTLSVGEPTLQAATIAALVLSANQAGRDRIRPGILASEVDAAARDVIVSSGHGKHFTHRTGHGIGLKAHEEPYISSTESTSLKAGMTFTIEPGIYLPDWGGVRIEDNMLVTSQGADTLTNLPRELWVI